ncbi:hypothetical protein [Arthrobacter sp. 08Y14]|uniref:hypothetical protein n=1 Tax=Arthrobacter sp. 08Y14 TaxID=2058885 RepID=UPI000CE35C59|nr:hypothetical protein [Arthrobacter sp. 08Y14]
MASIDPVLHIDVPWTDLTVAVEDMRAKASTTPSILDAASAAWNGLQQAYRHPGTQDRVYAALKDLRDPTVDWAVALSFACAAVQDFAAAGRPLQRESESLEAERAGLLRTAAEAEDSSTEDQDSAERAVTDFNDRVRSLRDRWNSLTASTAAELAGITGGTGDGLPVTAAIGGRTLPSVDWLHLTSTLDNISAIDPEAVVDSILHLNAEELREWAKVNPEAALVLATNKMPHHGRDPERTMGNVSSYGYRRERGSLAATLAPEGIALIRETWLNLTDLEQKRLLLLYPGTFGNMNGIPMEQRAFANIVTAAGLREQVTRQMAAMGGEPVKSSFAQNLGEQALYTSLRSVWDELNKKKTGLDNAVENNRQVVMASLEGDGRIVTMNGTPSQDAKTSTILVPGTSSDLSALEDYSLRLDNITSDRGADDVSFYWQGTDLPNKVPDNRFSSYNESGGPLLAGFDAALDLELSPETRSTYIGYSAGAALVGTAEREGLNSTNIIYLAPSGAGNEVDGVEDTRNQEAHRYWIQTRDDPIVLAQLLGGISQGGDPQQMDVVRLESGFIDHAKGGPLVSGHEEYFSPDSTAMLNMRRVVLNEAVFPYVPDEAFVDEGGVWTYSPLQTRPQNYAGEKMPSVPVESAGP